MAVEREEDSIETQGAPAEAESQSGARPQPEIDIQQLADKVYRLMCAEARLERSRGQQTGRS